MKRLVSLFLVALVSVALPAVSTPDVDAQAQTYVTGAAQAAASDIVNARIMSTTSVEVNGEMSRATEIEILSTTKGDLQGSVIVQTPGGERPDGAVVYVSHTPELIPGELVQLALMPAEPEASYVLPVATDSDLPVYSVAGGSAGAWGLLPDGVGQADAVGDYTLTGASWDSFSPGVPFNVNTANSGVSASGTISAVKRAFATWENDSGSDIDFSYIGTTSKSGLNLNDGENSVSWVNPPSGSGWLAQASWIATGSGDILGFDVQVSRNYNWSNGSSSGRYDIGTVVAHEVGHGIGFGHAPSSAELMYFQIQSGSTKDLGAGDESGAAFLYPIPSGSIRAESFSQSDTGIGISSEANDRFGQTAVTGDFNNDGREDFVVAAPGENGGQGAVVVMYRSSAGNTSFTYLSQNTSGVSGSAESGDLFGSSMTVGNFNGDSYDDLAVGSPGETLSGHSAAGLVHVFYGGSSGLSGSGSDSFQQDSSGVPGVGETGDLFGASLAAGDFDNDGRDDLAVGVPGEALGSLSNAGMVNVLYGTSSGISGSSAAGFSQSSSGIAGSAEATDEFGAALAAGDFDNDGRDDLAVGVPGEALGSLSDAGLINVLYGSSSGLRSTGNKTFTQSSTGVPGGAESGDRFGAALAAGDFDNDGRDDVAVGVPSEAVGSAGNAGVVNVLFGASNGLTGSGAQLLSQSSSGVTGIAESGDYFGAALAAGDFDGDNRSDLVVGVPGEGFGSVSNNGMVHVLYSNGNGLTGTGSKNLSQSTGNVSGQVESNDDFGSAVAVGDFDNDGCGDIASGIKGEDGDAGEVTILFGDDGTPGSC